MDKYFVYYDDVYIVLPFHKIKVLVYNNDDNKTYSLIDVPINISRSLNEYQNSVGRIIYMLDEKEDEDFIKNNSNIVKMLEGEENSYSIIKTYDKNNINIKLSSVGHIIPDLTKEYVVYNSSYKISYNDEIYVLRQNDDETVSVQKAPLFRKKKYLQYQLRDNCFAIIECKNDQKYNKNDIFKLEKINEENKYNIVKIYESNKIKTKKASFM